MARPKIILFDLDGTLVDTKEIVAEIYAEGLRKMGLSPPSLSKIMALSGLSTFETGRHLGVPENRLDEIDRWFWDQFRKFCEDPSEVPYVFTEVPSLLEFLTGLGIDLGIVTSNDSMNARLLMRKAKLERYFSAIIGFREVTNPKPSGEPIRIAVERISNGVGMDFSKDVWMVGDTDSDWQSALDAGVRPLILNRHLNSLNDLKKLL
ncbi:MAG: HAD family hydrolase [Methanobacteriota archaeon]|nr:MAG: HAD family hydrolase [Euryarchaeota archaeon]